MSSVADAPGGKGRTTTASSFAVNVPATLSQDKIAKCTAVGLEEVRQFLSPTQRRWMEDAGFQMTTGHSTMTADSSIVAVAVACSFLLSREDDADKKIQESAELVKEVAGLVETLVVQAVDRAREA